MVLAFPRWAAVIQAGGFEPGQRSLRAVPAMQPL